MARRKKSPEVAQSMPQKSSSVITPGRVRYAIRNRFNPIRDFTPAKLAQQLDMFHAGELKDVARTWDTMERRDIVLGNVAAKRKKAVSRLPYEILTVDDSAEAEAQAEYLKEFYDNIQATSVLEQDEEGGLSLLIRQMMDAVGKKFAVHEIIWKTGEQLSAEFRFCPLWWFENKSGQLQFLPSEGAIDGEPMARGEWLVTVGEGIMESCSVAYVFKHLPLKDWIAFSEKFGMPGVLGKTTAAKDSPEWEAMEGAVGAFGQDWAAVCSANGDTIELVEVKSGGNNLPYPPLVEYCDRTIASRWRGADLSTISQGQQGVGASLQGDETIVLLEDDAALISETLNRRVDPFVIQYKFGPVPPLAYIKIIPPRPDTTARDIQIDNFLFGLGLEQSVEDVMERYGRALPAKGETPVSRPEPEPTQGFANTASPTMRRDFAAATRAALKEVAERLQKIHAMTNEAEQRVALRDFLTAYPVLAKKVQSEETIAGQIEVLEKLMGDGFLKGAAKRRSGD